MSDPFIIGSSDRELRVDPKIGKVSPSVPYVEERTTGWVVCNKDGAIVARDFFDAGAAHQWLDRNREDPAAMATPKNATGE